METIPEIKASRREFVTRIRNRFDELQRVVADLMREALRENDMELQVRIERARKSAADKGEDVETLLEEAETEEDSEWPETQEALERAWVDYREAVDRARLEMERAEELS